LVKTVNATYLRRIITVRTRERLKTALAEVVRQESIGKWLRTPNPALDGAKPIG
jgi:hypothetical protein